ncbi:conjugal transfer protein TraG N-terminal domain-containing protein [soil metagenome]
MSVQLPIVVYGNGDMYRELFNAIAAAMGTSSYHYLIEMAILLTGTWAIMRYSVERSFWPLLRWLGLYYLAFYIVFIPKATVHIIDRINQGSGYAIDNVPFGLALTANLSSVIGDALTQHMEKTFSLPNDLLYGKTGMVMAARLAVASTQFQVTDPNFNQSIQSYVTQCVFYDLLLNKYSWSDLLNTPDIWGFVSNYASPARAFMYYQVGGPQVVTCKSGSAMMVKDWKNAVTDATARYAGILFPQSKDAKALLISSLPSSYHFLANISSSGQGILTQNLMMNAFQNGILHMGASTNSPAAMAAYSFTKAQQQKRLTNETVGDMAAYWLPIMRNVLEAILYGSFVFVWLLILFPFGPMVLKNYVGSLLWIQLWAPLYAILNLFINFYAQHLGTGIVGGAGNLTLLNQAGFAQANADVSSLAGYLSLSVPLLAAGIMKGMMSVFGHAAQYMGGVTQSSAQGAAGEAVAGNVSVGNMNYSNQSAFNTSANHFDTSARVSSGAYTTQTAGGSSLTMTPDGTQIMNNQSAISSLGTSVNLAKTLRASYSQQAEVAEGAAISHAHAYSDSSNSAMRTLFDLSKHQANSVATGDSWSVSSNAQATQAMGEVHRLTDKFAHDHNLSFDEAASVLGSAYTNESATVGIDSKNSLAGKAASLATGVSASANATGGYRHDATHSDSTRLGSTYAAAQDYIHDTNFAHNVDVVARAAKDHSYRTGDETGNRQVENMAASFDHAQSARHDMVGSLQSSENFRRSASLAEENAASINSNAGQVVFESLQKQGMSASQIENMMTHHPEQAQQMASQAVQGYTQNLVSHWNRDLPGSAAAVDHAAHAHDHAVTRETAAHHTEDPLIEKQHQENRQRIDNSAQDARLKSKDQLDQSAKLETQRRIDENTRTVESQHASVNTKGNAMQQKVTTEQARKRHSNTVTDFATGIDKKEY